MAAHLSLMLKPASHFCPMACEYCFYKSIRTESCLTPPSYMSDAILEAIVKKALATATQTCTFGFQGGEPTLAGLEFFKKVIQFQDQYNINKVQIQNHLQTSGLLLDDAWCAFLAKQGFLVGLSLDGPEEVHNRFRLLLGADGKPHGSFEKVMAAMELLQKHAVVFNILAVVSNASTHRGREIYRFFRRQKIQYLQLIPAMDKGFVQTGCHDFSLLPEDFAIFLQDVFDIWYADLLRGRLMSIDLIDRYLEKSLNMQPNSCFARSHCGVQNIFEADGSAYACDFFVHPDYLLGHVQDSTSLPKMMQGAADFVLPQIPSECQACEWFSLCQVGCKRYRELQSCRTKDDRITANKYGKSYYCIAYKSFFSSSVDRIQHAARLLSS